MIGVYIITKSKNKTGSFGAQEVEPDDEVAKITRRNPSLDDRRSNSIISNTDRPNISPVIVKKKKKDVSIREAESIDDFNLQDSKVQSKSFAVLKKDSNFDERHLINAQRPVSRTIIKSSSIAAGDPKMAWSRTKSTVLNRMQTEM